MSSLECSFNIIKVFPFSTRSTRAHSNIDFLRQKLGKVFPERAGITSNDLTFILLS